MESEYALGERSPGLDGKRDMECLYFSVREGKFNTKMADSDRKRRFENNW